jgi:hypothetical protein
MVPAAPSIKGWRMARKLTDTAHLKLRFDEKLRRRIEREAARNNRSMNAEIADRLEKSFEREEERSLMVQAATAVLIRTGWRVVTFGALAEGSTGESPQRHQVSHPVYLRLRFSEALRRQLEAAAGNNRWAMTVEIIERLERSFQRQDPQKRIEEAAGDALKGMRRKEKAP